MYRHGALLASRYRLDAKVGGGGMGEVWRGTDIELERTVAVKIVRAELLDEPGFRERFRAEARTMAKIKHPGVVAVHDYYSDQSGAFLVMEFVEGEPLSATLRREGRLEPARAMQLIADAADALQAAHDRGIVHRDIKPGNLMLSGGGKVMLTDFGIARSASSTSLTATGALIGTVSYLAPEQVLGHPATAGSDVYALGVVAYECIAGRRPFEGDNPFDVAMRRLREAPPTIAVDVPPAVLAVVEKALAAEPENRWQTATELAIAARRAVSPDAPAGPISGPGSVSGAGGPARGGAAPITGRGSSPSSGGPISDGGSAGPGTPMSTGGSSAGGSSGGGGPVSGGGMFPGASHPAGPAGAPSPGQDPFRSGGSNPGGRPGSPGGYGWAHPGTSVPPASPPPYQQPATSGRYPPGGYRAPGYPPGGTPPSGYPPPPPHLRPVSSLGVVSMILGIASVPLVCCYIGAPVGVAAVAVGIVALVKANDQRVIVNRGQAIAGIACGATALVGFFPYWLIDFASL